MDTTIAQIQAQYPAPMAEAQGTGRTGEYCVGSAVCRFYGYAVEDFVGEHELASILAQINPALDNPPEEDNEEEVPGTAWQFANAITTHNDARDFAAAWWVAGEALAQAQPCDHA